MPAAPAVPACTAVSWQQDVLHGALAVRSVPAAPAVPAVAALAAVAAAAGGGDEGQRAGELADGDLGDLARGSVAAPGAVARVKSVATVTSVARSRDDRCGQPVAAEPGRGGRRGDPVEAAGSIPASRSTGTV